MAEKIRLTKNELKKQKDALKRYVQYLPTLILKKQQLQAELLKIHQEMENIKQERAYSKAEIYHWVDVFNEKVNFEELVRFKRIVVSSGNVAGADIPVFEDVEFEEKEYDLVFTPYWVDAGIAAFKDVVKLNARMEVTRKQENLVHEELRKTTQRVNLFEKVMIPEKERNIKKVQIYLGDMEIAQVATGKIAKDKILANNGM